MSGFVALRERSGWKLFLSYLVVVLMGVFALAVLLLLAQVLPLARAAPSTPATPGTWLFIENVGQFDAHARFQGWGGPGALWLAEDGLWLTLVERPASEPSARPGERLEVEPRQTTAPVVNLKLSFVGANPHPHLEPFRRLETHFSYFIGDDPADWHTDVPVWGGVRYVDLYPGVDLVLGAGLAAAPGQAQASPLRWYLQARRSADLSAVRLRVEGAEGVVVEEGDVRLTTAVGEIALPLLEPAPGAPPRVRRTAEGAFEIASPFAARPTDLARSPRSTAQDDESPILAYATYLGGYFYDRGRDVTVDSAGDAYVVGSTQSPDFPTTPGVPGEFYNGGDYDAFVAKLNSSGSTLAFATFLGGVGDDWGDDFGYGVALDGSDNVYVTGWTDSRTFPVTAGAYDTTYNGGVYDVFAAKLNATGSALVYATFLGGADQEKGVDVEADGAGGAYLTGWTASVDFPSAAADSGFSSFHGGASDVFVAKLNAVGSALEYALFVGGGDLEIGTSLAVDEGGYACVTGWTESSDFPWRLAVDYDLSGDVDAFVTRVRPSGYSLFSSTYLGGSGDEIGWDIAVDGQGDVYVVGATDSTDLPVTTGAFDTSYNGGNVDAFVAKLSVSTLQYATYLGDDGDEQGYGIAVDDAGSAYVTGDLGDDAITRLDPTGGDVDYRFTVAGFGACEGDGVAVDAQGGVYVLAYAGYETLPVTPGAFDATPDHIWLARVALPALITGRVTDSDDQPLAGIQVAAGDVYSATTDASGQYTLSVAAGGLTFAPVSPGYFWSPASRSATVPPDVTGQDFVGKSVAKDVTPGGAQAVDYGDTLTYTVRLVAPEDRAVMLYDPVPTYTTFINGSLNALPGVGYDVASDAISGALTLTLNTPSTVTFQVRVGVAGSAGWAPPIVNRACVYPPGEALSACEWSNETTNNTYQPLVYLPLVLR